MYNIEKSIDNNDTKNFINTRFLKIAAVILGIIFSLTGASILGLFEKTNPVLAGSVLFTGLFVVIFLISKCIDNKIIPYFLLQFINIWIFFNQDIFSPLGLNFKPHVIIFSISLLITFYYIFTNFKYLWSNLEFKLLLLFFILIIFYAFFYSSDFRSSSYIDIWIQNNLGLKYASIGSGYGAASREFGSEETKFLKYLTAIIPFISFVIGYMSFYGLKTIEKTKKKLEDIINRKLSDIFESIESSLKKIGRNGLLPAGVIFTGGGSGLVGLEESAKSYLKLPTKIAPINLNPAVKNILLKL